LVGVASAAAVVAASAAVVAASAAGVVASAAAVVVASAAVVAASAAVVVASAAAVAASAAAVVVASAAVVAASTQGVAVAASAAAVVVASAAWAASTQGVAMAASTPEGRLRVPRLRVPRLRVPRLRVPRLRVPRLRVPRLRVPRLKVPNLQLSNVQLMLIGSWYALSKGILLVHVMTVGTLLLVVQLMLVANVQGILALLALYECLHSPLLFPKLGGDRKKSLLQPSLVVGRLWPLLVSRLLFGKSLLESSYLISGGLLRLQPWNLHFFVKAVLFLSFPFLRSVVLELLPLPLELSTAFIYHRQLWPWDLA
jgi:hypothetical protein